MPAPKPRPAVKSAASGKPAARPNKVADKLARLGLKTAIDLALHLPMRYEDETQVVPIAAASFMGGSHAQVEGVVTSCDVQFRPRRQLVVTIADDSGPLVMRFLNFYGSQTTQLAEGTRVRARGEVRHGFFGAEMVHPAYKVINEGAPLPTALTPVYPAGEGLSQVLLRKAIHDALAQLDWHDTLPDALCAALGLMPFEQAVRLLHNPPAEVDEHALEERSHPAWVRMKFDELLAQQLSLKRAQQARRNKGAAPLTRTAEISAELLAALPFQLTPAQQRVLTEIRADLHQPYPMQRLLQGDVGSGKTVVAALAAAQAIDSGYQAVLMAPTEILAEQHFHKIAAWLEPLGVPVAWLTGSLKKKQKQEALAKIESGHARLVIGTHALIQEGVQFEQLGLVVVDEQHRFGVGQRLALRNKGLADVAADVAPADSPDGMGDIATVPHQLMMSATPIPRTLAMTYYADLEVSVIDQLPPGRTPIVTRVVDQNRREEVIARVHAAAQEGRQAYWVCPLIEESEALQLQTATDTHAALQAALPDLRVGLVHGRLKPAEKQMVMEAFIRGETHVLVATTVIEVGVDVPNASLMVIEHAERFGLSQLHQLRGRVGRGAAASVCLLLYQSPLGPVARQRLMTMRETTDGFEIARRDLEIRGPGEFLGARQSGQALLRFADLETDQWLVEKARDTAHMLLQNDPATVTRHLARWLGEKEEFLKV
ncbi:ATP-dependent DNA helicase RecG [Noviherbaspirillum sedimenti]|uniref:ATP-dependent DNA helicase RecG n=1 Tax=Noviherbaspirillum sedimenti TaxID=2320865 RepID=A0A3A3G3D0_9BURK|nr:ATP-dependent DNA helicase RecG [Noviherbaspirillum sedimenti]RJG02175.1 ATP-dependent DNA helicase RecG [Noviherbaspirillum sedimenti]